MAFDSSGAKAVLVYQLGTTPKRCELQLFLAGIRQAIRRYKAFHLGRLNMQSQQDCPKDEKNYISFNFLAENLERFRSTELYCAALEGSTIFLCRISLGSTSIESCQLSGLKILQEVKNFKTVTNTTHRDARDHNKQKSLSARLISCCEI